jgi:hypothetical protein
MLLGLEFSKVTWNETRNQKLHPNSAIDVLGPRAMWELSQGLRRFLFLLRKWSGTIGTTETLERLEPALA